MQSQADKQAFLRHQIIDNGHNPQQFVAFLTKQKQNGGDLNNWTIQQLHQIVKKYVQQIQQDTNQHQQQIIKPQQLKIQQPQIKHQKKNLLRFQKYDIIQPAMLQQIKCRIAPKQIALCKLISPINVSEHSDGGYFFGLGQTTYLLFKVQTTQFKWTVRRRYSDFQWLRNSLSRLHPQHIVPPLPRKNKNKRTRLDLDRRMKILQFFLNDIATNSQLFRQNYVKSFLSQVDRQKFQRIMKQTDNISSPKFIHQYQAPQGNSILRIDQSTRITIDHLGDFIYTAQSKYKESTKLSKKLHNSLKQAQQALYGMGQNFTQLVDCYSLFDQRFGAQSQKKLRGLFISMQNLVVDWANSIGETVEDIASNLIPYFKYLRHQTYSFKQLLQRTQKLQDDYLSYRKNLNRKKQKLLALGDPSKMQILVTDMKALSKDQLKQKNKLSELACGKQQKQCNSKRLDYAFYSNSLYNRTRDTIKLIIRRTCSNFDQFSIKSKCQAQRLCQLFSQSSTWFDISGYIEGGIKIPKKVIKEDIIDD